LLAKLFHVPYGARGVEGRLKNINQKYAQQQTSLDGFAEYEYVNYLAITKCIFIELIKNETQ
jgi:hypothetical protein